MMRHDVKLGMTVYRGRGLGRRRAGTRGTVTGVVTRFGHYRWFVVRWADGTEETLAARDLWKTPTGKPGFRAKGVC